MPYYFTINESLLHRNMTILSHGCPTWNRDIYKCIYLHQHQKVCQLPKRWQEMLENLAVGVRHLAVESMNGLSTTNSPNI